MPIARATLFQPDPGKPLDFAGVTPADVYNSQAESVNKWIDGPGLDLDGENALAATRRDEQAQHDTQVNLFQDQEDANLFRARRAAQKQKDRLLPFEPNGEDQLLPEARRGLSRDNGQPSNAGTPTPYSPSMFSTSSGRAARASRGGSSILLDSNSAEGVPVIAPRIVIPDNASQEQRDAAKKYVDGVAALQKRQFGRTLKPQVLTRSENKRGRSNAIHTEGFAVTDRKFVDYIRSEKGRKEYQNLLRSTLGSLPGAKFHLPHSAKDPGAVNQKQKWSEVSLAQELLGDL